MDAARYGEGEVLSSGFLVLGSEFSDLRPPVFELYLRPVGEASWIDLCRSFVYHDGYTNEVHNENSKGVQER